MLKERVFNIVYVNESAPKKLDFETTGIIVKYNGTTQTVQF